MVAKYTISNLRSEFPDDDACLDWLRHRLYPERITCQKCGKESKFHRVKGRKVYECDWCGYQLSPTAGTIFHKSSTPLTLWFHAIFRMAQTRCGISAAELGREIGVTYKTAWRMFTQIRKLMDEDIDPFDGQVEADEMYVGGARRGGKRGRGAAGKTPVAGIIQRGGKVMAQTVPNVQAKTLLPIIKAQVLQNGTTTVFTDEMSSYNKLSETGYTHERIRHSSKVYVQGTAHTNSIEGFWSLVKHGIDGAHHSVSAKFLQSGMMHFTQVMRDTA